MLGATFRVGRSPDHVRFNVVDHMTLCIHQHGDVHEDTVQLHKVPLNSFHTIVPFLDLSDGLDEVPTALLSNRLL